MIYSNAFKSSRGISFTSSDLDSSDGTLTIKFSSCAIEEEDKEGQYQGLENNITRLSQFLSTNGIHLIKLINAHKPQDPSLRLKNSKWIKSLDCAPETCAQG